MAQEHLTRNIPLYLSHTREIVISHFRPLLNHFGLTEQQWRILRVLYEENKCEPKVLCETCQIFSSSMPGILKRLKEMELIKRIPIKEDKRRVNISLTKKSISLMQEMLPLVQKQYQLLEEAWGEELIEQLNTVIDIVLKMKDTKVERVVLPPKSC